MRASEYSRIVVATLSAVIAAAAPPALAQSASTAKGAKSWSVPKTPDGQPDLQGVWDFRTITPLERPRGLGERAVFTVEEAAEFEREQNQKENRDLIDDKKGGSVYPAGGVVPYNEFWYDRGNTITGTKRTSLIVDPKDGRLPPLTPDGQRRVQARAQEGRESQAGRPKADSHLDRPLTERCVIGFNAGPPMTPGAYNNNVQIVQTAGTVAIMNEMVHDVRLVPLDGRPRTSMRYGMGESRGHWEGNTLVVETANFDRETSLAGSTSTMRLVERFTRTDPKTLLYEFTVTDPATWASPWTAQLSMVKLSDEIYEYACHEGNYGLAGVLLGARMREKQEAARPASKSN